MGAGQTRGFLVMTSSSRGMVLRAKHQYAWVAGEESERDDNVVVRTGTKECVHDRSETPSYLYGTKECGPLAQHIRTRMHAHTHTRTHAHTHVRTQVHTRAGLLPCGWDDTADAAFKRVYHPLNAAAFVGVLDYSLC